MALIGRVSAGSKGVLCNKTKLQKLKTEEIQGEANPLSNSCLRSGSRQVLLHRCLRSETRRKKDLENNVPLQQNINVALSVCVYYLSQRLGSDAWVSLCKISTKPISLNLSCRSWEPVEMRESQQDRETQSLTRSLTHYYLNSHTVLKHLGVCVNIVCNGLVIHTRCICTKQILKMYE